MVGDERKDALFALLCFLFIASQLTKKVFFFPSVYRASPSNPSIFPLNGAKTQPEKIVHIKRCIFRTCVICPLVLVSHNDDGSERDRHLEITLHEAGRKYCTLGFSHSFTHHEM